MTTHHKGSYGGMGLGDITGWAKSTVTFQRPQEMIIRRNGRMLRSPKVHNLAALRAFHAKREAQVTAKEQPAIGFVAPIHTA